MPIEDIKQQRILRQKLREEMTPTEKKLWDAIRRKTLSSYQFKRKARIKNYIVDFYCPELKLVIEVVKETTASDFSKNYEKIREIEITALGIKVLRVTQKDVEANLADVVKIIVSNIEASALLLAPSPKVKKWDPIPPKFKKRKS
jgi:very-short-patch-repair endonuclease